MENPTCTTDTESPPSEGIKSLRILCFGDSLTAGYSSWGYSHYPYAAQIREELRKAFPATEAHVVVSEEVWAVALATGANVLALSVLEAQHTVGDVVQRRNDLNEMIAQHSDDRWHYMDLCAAVPYFDMSDFLRERIWDDGLHLTMAGYEMMGQAIAAKLIELLRVSEKPVHTDGKTV
ncbi:MAG: hypothetical protein Q9172_000168 [Xanthocarpia lactea]